MTAAGILLLIAWWMLFGHALQHKCLLQGIAFRWYNWGAGAPQGCGLLQLLKVFFLIPGRDVMWAATFLSYRFRWLVLAQLLFVNDFRIIIPFVIHHLLWCYFDISSCLAICRLLWITLLAVRDKALFRIAVAPALAQQLRLPLVILVRRQALLRQIVEEGLLGILILEHTFILTELIIHLRA